MSNLKFKTNVSHEGRLFRAGNVVDDLASSDGNSVVQNLLSRDLVEMTEDAPTHSSIESDSIGNAKPLVEKSDSQRTADDKAASAEEVAAKAQADAEAAAAQEAEAKAQAEAIAAAEAEQAKSAEEQVAAAQPSEDDIAATAANVQ